MNTGYVDKNGKDVHVGSILKYDEGPGFARALHEVIEVDGEPHGITRIGEPRWSVVENDNPVHLKFYTCRHWDVHNNLTDAEVIGNVRDNPELMTPEHAKEIWPVSV